MGQVWRVGQVRHVRNVPNVRHVRGGGRGHSMGDDEERGFLGERDLRAGRVNNAMNNATENGTRSDL